MYCPWYCPQLLSSECVSDERLRLSRNLRAYELFAHISHPHVLDLTSHDRKLSFAVVNWRSSHRNSQHRSTNSRFKYAKAWNATVMQPTALLAQGEGREIPTPARGWYGGSRVTGGRWSQVVARRPWVERARAARSRAPARSASASRSCRGQRPPTRRARATAAATLLR